MTARLVIILVMAVTIVGMSVWLAWVKHRINKLVTRQTTRARKENR